ncbi:MAG: M6 family metalloprotease domain-containing protein [Dactylosporangium sp.]|nr:immune inhibitor A [Dactylosporangium sp.]NNJ63793.1 M6 family metalloprotease domain-containing protein [Dactylosporangium sp.]
MRKWTVGLISLTLVSGTGVFAVGAPVAAAPAQSSVEAAETAPGIDDLPNPLEEKRREAREAALTGILSGEIQAEERGASTVAKVGSKAVRGKGNAGGRTRVDQYVELSREKTDKIFVVLAEFGDERHADYPDQDTDPSTLGPTVFDGPLHNQMPEPDRTLNNSTYWKADFSQEYFQNLYFGTGADVESLKTYYEKQSSGRYSVNGTVTEWVKVPYTEARYGRSNGFPCTSSVCSNVWELINDALAVWVTNQHAAGLSDAEIAAELASFDQWDRYDYDGDGDFNEADGYIDRFQVVHAGGDQADGDPYQGEDAIWSHRWYSYFNNFGKTGPEFNQLGGSPVGSTGLWVGDYTVQPENGGLDVFAHEYGHDLGLPDHYDTSGGGDNPVNWWTIMAQSRVSAPGDNAISSRAADLSAWDKLQLGWLDYEVVQAGEKRTLNLGPHEYNSRKPQAAVVVLPKKEATTVLPTPPEGSKQWWSGKGDELNNTLTRQVTLPAEAATLAFQATWDIEDCGPDPCDYAFVEVDAGSGFVAIPGSITNPEEGNGIDGTSESPVAAVFDLSAYAGQTIALRFRYLTDGAVGGKGFFADDITVTAGDTTVFADGAEDGDNGWTAVGFTTVGSSLTNLYDNYYIMSNRSWVSYDQYLKSGPYNFGFLPEKPSWVEHFPYQEGLLVSYWDTSQSDNNTSQHHGEGLILPIDAHPELIYRTDGLPWRGRVQGYDAPFSLRRADSFTLHNTGVASYVWGQAGVPVFDDSRDYYAEDVIAGLYYGVKIPNHNVRVRVLHQNGTRMRIRIT